MSSAESKSDLKGTIRRENQKIPLETVRASALSIICLKQSAVIFEKGYVENL